MILEKLEFLVYAIVFLAEGLISWLYFEHILPRKARPEAIALSFTVGFFLLYGLCFAGRAVLDIAACFAVHLFLCRYCYRCPIKTAVLNAAFLTFCISAAEKLMTLVAAFFVRNYVGYTYHYAALLSVAASSRMLYLLVTVIVSRIAVRRSGRAEESAFLLLLSLAPVLSTVTAIAIVFGGTTLTQPRKFDWIMTGPMLILLIINILVLISYNFIRKINRERLSVQLSNLQTQADLEYYGMLKDQYDEQRILIHDMKNHLQVIHGLAAQGDTDRISAYVAGLTQAPEFAARTRVCDNAILNIIVLRYMDYCGRNGISFYCDIRGDCVSRFDDAGITALFDNLLSNAVEAAERSARKTIEFAVYRNTEQGFLIISLVNSSDTPPTRDAHGYFMTGKADKELHGIGSRSIRAILKKYGGLAKAYYDASKKEFHCIMQFPV